MGTNCMGMGTYTNFTSAIWSRFTSCDDMYGECVMAFGIPEELHDGNG